MDTKIVILFLCLCAVQHQVSCTLNADEGHCLAEEPDKCHQTKDTARDGHESDKDPEVMHTVPDGAAKTEGKDDESFPQQIIHRGIEGLEGMFDQVASSKAKVMEGLDTMMDRMSESKDKMMESFDSVMDKMTKSKEKVMEKVREGIDKVAHSKMMEELDHVIESVAHSKVMEEIRALPRELRESFILSVRNRSYLIAGLLVAVASVVLFCGAIYYAWCHHDAWSYHIGTVEDAKALLKKAKEKAEKCVASASMASKAGDFASELCNMSTRVCQAEGSQSNHDVKEEAGKEPKGCESNRDAKDEVIKEPKGCESYQDAKEETDKGPQCLSEFISNTASSNDAHSPVAMPPGTSNGHVIAERDGKLATEANGSASAHPDLRNRSCPNSTREEKENVSQSNDVASGPPETITKIE